MFKFGEPGPSLDVPPNFGFRFRIATVNDLKEIMEIAKSVEFYNSVPVLKLYMETSPLTFFVCENTETGKIVAFDSFNRLPNGIYQGFQIVIHPSVQGKGISRLMKTMDNANFHLFGDQTNDSLKRFPMSIFSVKIIDLYGKIDRSTLQIVDRSESILVKKIKESDFPDIFKFDFLILGIDRSQFIRKWTSPTTESGIAAHTYIARNDSNVLVGYGTIVWYDTYWQIIPLYANSIQISENILAALLREVKPDQDVFLRGPASCHLLHSLKKSGLEFVGTETRSYSDKFTYDVIEAKLDWSKVYVLQEFWPV